MKLHFEPNLDFQLQRLKHFSERVSSLRWPCLGSIRE